MATRYQPQSARHWRPDGQDQLAYGDWASWTSEQWDWEFLRRHEVFQEFCDEARKLAGDESRMKAEVITAKSFRLKRFKHYDEPFESDTSPRPEFELLRTMVLGSEVGPCEFETRVFRGDVVVQFNVSQALKNARALTEQVTWYKTLLQEELVKLEKQRGQTADKQNNTKEAKQLLQYLRLLDGITANMPLHEIAKLVFAHKDRQQSALEWREIAKMPLQRALELVRRREI